MINKFAASQLYAGLTRAVLAAALISASLAASIGLPAPRQAALPDPLRVVQRILPDEFEAQPIENAEAGERPSSPDGAAAFRRKQLVNEKGEIPLEAPAKAAALYETARMRTRLSPAPNAAGITPGAWTFEGPNNTGGRIRSIVAPTA
ncbi:MAG: hypothetical protein KAX36_04720, partial [Thermoflexales bacterium]|nr:hypothetical protein [Thermoflexales bacterium]